jgi:hypothetical protein
MPFRALAANRARGSSRRFRDDERRDAAVVAFARFARCAPVGPHRAAAAEEKRARDGERGEAESARDREINRDASRQDVGSRLTPHAPAPTRPHLAESVAIRSNR